MCVVVAVVSVVAVVVVVLVAVVVAVDVVVFLWSRIRFLDCCARLCWVLISRWKQAPNRNDHRNHDTESGPQTHP